jgi:hypothetical protein
VREAKKARFIFATLTALDRCGTAEGSADRLGQGLGAVNDE